jgi:cell division protein FtsW
VKKSVLYVLGLVVAFVVALGLVVLSSASEDNGIRLYNDAYHFIKRQSIFLAVGILLCAVVAAVDYRRWRDNWILTVLFYLVVVVLLVLVFNYKKVNGSHRWIPIGPVRLQPGELAKIVCVIATAVWYDRIAWKIDLWKYGILFPGLIVAIPIGLIVKAPDFGSVMVIGLSIGLIMFIAGVKMAHLIPVFFLGMGAVGVILSKNKNRMGRLTAFMDSSSGASSASYQANQALIALQNGGIRGEGLGNSMQKHYYLPEAHTDFIFAVGAEELGLAFTIVVLALFTVIFICCIHIARNASDRFGKNLVIGMMFLIVFQAFFNLGVVCKAFPTKGMALPFFTYGGTNLLCTFFAIGTILSVGIHSLDAKKRAFLRKVVLK